MGLSTSLVRRWHDPFPSFPVAEGTRYRVDPTEYGPFGIIEAYDATAKRARIFAFVRDPEKFQGGQAPHSVFQAIDKAEKEWASREFTTVCENLVFADHRGRIPFGSGRRYYLDGVTERV
jgi:hypothetical protein